MLATVGLTTTMVGLPVFGPAILLPAANAAQAPCTPQAPYTGCVRVTYSGSSETWTVPAGVTSVKIQAWGAGGGGLDSSYWSGGSTGASGGYAEGITSVKGSDVLAIVVGGGGQIKSTSGTFGGGGAGGPGGPDSVGSSGGGYSGVFKARIARVCVFA